MIKITKNPPKAPIFSYRGAYAFIPILPIGIPQQIKVRFVTFVYVTRYFVQFYYHFYYNVIVVINFQFSKRLL